MLLYFTGWKDLDRGTIFEHLQPKNSLIKPMALVL